MLNFDPALLIPIARKIQSIAPAGQSRPGVARGDWAGDPAKKPGAIAPWVNRSRSFH